MEEEQIQQKPNPSFPCRMFAGPSLCAPSSGPPPALLPTKTSLSYFLPPPLLRSGDPPHPFISNPLSLSLLFPGRRGQLRTNGPRQIRKRTPRPRPLGLTRDLCKSNYSVRPRNSVRRELPVLAPPLPVTERQR